MSGHSPNHETEQLPDAPKLQRRFQFIDNNNVTSMGSNSTQVRRHVMREYMREKRWEARSKFEDGRDAEPRIHKNDVPKSRSQRQIHQRRPRGQTTATPRLISPRIGAFPLDSTTPPSPSSAQHTEEVNCIEPLTPAESRRRTTSFFLRPADFATLVDLIPDATWGSLDSPTSKNGKSSPISSCTTMWILNGCTTEPRSILSAARTDPFDCLPMRLCKQDQELFDFYAVIMPTCSYGLERRSLATHDWYLSVFIPEAMQGVMCFQNIILSHAASTQAWVRGQAETPLSIKHRATASQTLHEYFERSPHEFSDAAITATISAAALEDLDPRVARRKLAWLHWRTVVQMIRDRGGPAALVNNDRLQKLIHWFDYVFSGYNAHGATFYFDYEYSPSHSNDLEAEVIARQEIGQQCAEFITFLKCAEHLSMVQANIKHNPVVRRQQWMRYSVFEPGQPLFNLVASPNGPRCTTTGRFIQLMSRLAALLTINTAIWEYRHSSDLSEAFFQELMQNIKSNKLDKNISVEALIKILLSGSKEPALRHTERPWFVGRMLKIAKRLSRPTFEKLNDVLLGFLALDRNLQPVTLEWENQLRAEILQAPLVNYVLPCMQGQSEGQSCRDDQ